MIISYARPQLLSSYADLIALGAQLDGYAVQCMGYYAPADGGGGLFVYSGGVPIRVTERTILSVKQKGAKGDNTPTSAGTDDYAAIMSALDEVAKADSSGIVVFPAGRYRTTHQIRPPYGGVTLLGDGGGFQSSYGAVSAIVADHSEDAVLNFQGLASCSVRDLGLIGGALSGAYPKTGLLLTRTSAASASSHTFDRICIAGKFGVAGLINVAAEGVVFRDLRMLLSADSPAPYGVYLSGGNGSGLSPAIPLFGSSLITCNFYAAQIGMLSVASNISTVYIDGSIALACIMFHGGYLTQLNGNYVTIRSGVIDGMETLGPIIFDGVGGESAGVPVAGFNLCATASVPAALRDLDIRRCNFGVTAAGKYILQDAYTKLVNAHIEGRGGYQEGTDPNKHVVLASNQIGALYSGANATSANLAAGTNGNCYIDVGTGPIAATPM